MGVQKLCTWLYASPDEIRIVCGSGGYNYIYTRNLTIYMYVQFIGYSGWVKGVLLEITWGGAAAAGAWA